MQKEYVKSIAILLIILYTLYINIYIKYSINLHDNNLIINNPKISVIIPVYNGGRYLNYSLKSIQNQKMKDIEIIIVDDKSNDESIKIIKHFMKYDNRIKLIQNKENRRILFCKSIGALNSKGKYIVELDQDDMFIRDDALDIIYNESETYNLDLLHFKYISGENFSNIPKIINNYSKNNNIIEQPELKFTVFKTNRLVLWGNLIKNDLYKKVIYNIWPIIINYKIIFQEDFLITFFILIYCHRYKMIKNVLYFYFKNINSASKDNKRNLEYYLSVIFAGIIFQNYYIDYYSEDIQIIINYINFLENDFKFIKKMFPSFFNFFFGKILSNKNLSLVNKNYILKCFNISENCDNYTYFKKIEAFIPNESFPKNVSFDNIKSQLIEFSIIIIYTDFEQIIKLINNIKKNYCESLEIILIFDGTSIRNYISPLKKIDFINHIKLINHENKKGTIYSITEGVMIAKGKYIMILNPNCIFKDLYFLQNIYKEIKDYDVDIFEINLYKILSNNYTNLYKCKHFISKFDLSKIKYNLNFKEIDINNELMTNKLFKVTFFKNIIKKFKLDSIIQINDYYYNNIFSFIIDSTSHKFKHINNVNIYLNERYFDKKKFNEFLLENNQLINETIFYINFMFDNSEDTFIVKEKILDEFFNVLSIIFNKFTKVSESSIKLLKKFIDCKYWNQTKSPNPDLIIFLRL